MSVRWPMRLVRALSCAALICLLVPRGADAHAELLRSVPAAGSIVAAAPATVRLSFSEPVEVAPDALIVLAPDGSRVDARNAAVAADDRSEVGVTLQPASRGTYSVRWSAVSADGHAISGTFQFSVGLPSAVAAAAAAPPDTSTDLWLQAAGRWLHLVALVLLAGPLVLLMLIGSDQPIIGGPPIWRLARIGSVLLVPAAALLLVGQLAGLHESLGAALRPDAVTSLLGTRWGWLWLTRLACAVALIALAWWPLGPAAARFTEICS